MHRDCGAARLTGNVNNDRCKTAAKGAQPGAITAEVHCEYAAVTGRRRSSSMDLARLASCALE